MRIISLLGSIAMLVLPFGYISQSVGDATATVIWMSFLWIDMNSEVLGFNRADSETFQISWLEENGLYHSYFDPLFVVGIAVAVMLIINIFISAQASKNNNKNIPAIILIACGIALFIIRLTALNESDLSFYTKDTFFGFEYTYLEIPLGFIWGLLFGILDLKN